MLYGGQNYSAGKSWPLHEMQFESISSRGQQTLTTTGHKPVPVCSSYTVWMQAMHLISLTEPTWLPAGKQTGLYFTSHLVFLVPQANSGVRWSPWKWHQHCSDIKSTDSGANSKTHFPSPISLSVKTLPQTRAGLRAHTWWYRHSLIAGMELCHIVMH